MKKIFAILGMIALLTACDPSRIDIQPNSATEAVFFSTTDEFRAALYGAYSVVYQLYIFAPSSGGVDGGNDQQRGLASLWKLPGDDLTEINGGRSMEELFDPGLNPTATRVSMYWNKLFAMVQAANVVIQKANTVDYSGYENAEEIPQIHGEALALRAWAYFELFKNYGGAPLFAERLADGSETSINPPRADAADILDLVISDLNQAEGLMADSWTGVYRGRLTKNSARGLLMKALVTRAAYYDNAADYSEAANIIGRISNVLLPDYSSNFDAMDENNEEAAWEWQAAQPGAFSNIFLHTHGPWRGVENMSFFRGHSNARSDWTKATTYILTDKLVNLAGADPRIAFWTTSIAQGRVLEKYTKEGYDVATTRFGGLSSFNNERIMRYSDLKLIAAEAALKSGNPAAAIGHINDVRARAKAWGETLVPGEDFDDLLTPNLALPEARDAAETNAGTIMQWIMDERFIELAGEGHRWDDLRRWHASGDVNLSGWGGGDDHFSTFLDSNTFGFDVNKHLLLPIPQTEIDRNASINENNPGY